MGSHHVNVHILPKGTLVRAFMAGLQYGSSLADLNNERLVIGATSLHLDLEKMIDALLAQPSQQDSNREQPHCLLTR